MLSSTLWYFTSVWGGSRPALRTIRRLLRNYLWSGSDINCRARVRWDDLCLHRVHGGLSLLDPEITREALLGKWIIHSLEPGTSNLKTLLRHRIAQINPTTRGGRWRSSTNWLPVHGFSSPRGSSIWTKVIQVWKKLVRCTAPTIPTTREDVITTSLWWASKFIGGNFGFSIPRGHTLHNRGLRNIGNLWDVQAHQLKMWDQLRREYNLTPADRPFLLALRRHLPDDWLRLLRRRPGPLAHQDWLGLFVDPADPIPAFVCQAQPQFLPDIFRGPAPLPILASVQLFTVRAQSRQLRLEQPAPPLDFFGADQGGLHRSRLGPNAHFSLCGSGWTFRF